MENEPDTFALRLSRATPVLQHLNPELRAAALEAAKNNELAKLADVGPVLDGLCTLGIAEGLASDDIAKQIAATIEG